MIEGVPGLRSLRRSEVKDDVETTVERHTGDLQRSRDYPLQPVPPVRFETLRV